MRISIPARSGNSIVGKLVMSGFGLFFAFIGTQFVKQEWKHLQEVKAMQDWHNAPCIIAQSEVEDHGEEFRLVIEYTYRVGDQTFTGNRFSLNKYYTAESIGEIKQTEVRFDEGKQVECYYDPDDPANSVLELPTVKGAFTTIGFTMIFPAFGLFFALLPWMRRKKKEKIAAQATTAEPARSPKKFLIIFGCIFAGIGLLMLKPFLITPLAQTRDAQNWNRTQATVISSKVKSHSGDDGTTYSVYIAYQYEVDGQEYYGDRYTFMGGSSSGYDSKAAIVRQYPKGHVFDVFFNPSDPSDSVILRDYSLSLLFGLIPLAFSIIGIAVVFFGIRNKPPALDKTQLHQQIVQLKGPSPVKKAVGVSLFTFFWLIIVYVLARSDAPLLFPVVFGFFGLLSVLASLQAILRIFTPQPEVEITPGDIHPGSGIAMRWRLSGHIDRIENLTIRIECLKVTTETRRSGGESRTSVVKTPLFENELLQTASQFEIAQGTLQFSIPDDRPASRPGKHNGIHWQVVFIGAISRWPDMKCEMPFTVYPQG